MTVNIADFPADLHQTLETLNKDIEFVSSSVKGENGYVIFGLNRVLKRPDVIKLYYWNGGVHAEPEILAKLEHPNILKVYHASSINEDWAYYTTKHCDGGDLDGVLAGRDFGLRDAIDATMMAASGVSFLHSHSFIHRDLKPENLYVDGNSVVIGDFGSVAPCNADGYCRTYTRHSLIYRPPEALVTNDHYKTSDVYQLGILLYQLCGGYFPYEGRDWLSVKQQKIFDDLTSKSDKESYFVDIIEKRIGAGRILELDTLHPFIPNSVKTIIRTATRVDRSERYASVAEMLAVMNNKKGDIPDWRINDDFFVLHRQGKTIRVKVDGNSIIIEKDAGGGWRKHNAAKAETIREAIVIAEEL